MDARERAEHFGLRRRKQRQLEGCLLDLQAPHALDVFTLLRALLLHEKRCLLTSVLACAGTLRRRRARSAPLRSDPLRSDPLAVLAVLVKGICKELQEELFSPFARGTSDQESRVGGLGLGLYICRSIVELHGGTIGVTSEEGSGSTFSFELPVVH